MKRSVILIAALGALILPLFSFAQTSGSTQQDDATKSLDIARNILKAAAGISDDFVQYKGDFIQKDGSGNSYYKKA